MTASCRDADPIPKVAGAGEVVRLDDGTEVQLMHNGLRVLAGGYYGTWMTEVIRRLRGHHEPQEERIFHEVVAALPPEATMIELGGFWAYYTLWFLAGSPSRRAVVLEPDPAHLAVGQRNAALNGLSPVFLNGFAGPVPRPPSPFKTESSGEVALPCRSVPDLMAEHGIERLDLLHCDIQGAETEVIESCLPLFRNGRIGWVVVSTHVHHISGDPLTHQRCLALLREAGATIEAEHDVHESFSGDGLIVARFAPAPPGWAAPSLTFNRYSTSMFRNPLYDLALTLRPGSSR